MLIEFGQESFNLKKSDEFFSLMANLTQVNLNLDPGGLTRPQKWVQFGVTTSIVSLNNKSDIGPLC